VLNVSGERGYPVPPLVLPGSGGDTDAAPMERSEAVQLFVERAQAVMPEFPLTDSNAAAVASICRRLDGLPLAIELAAVRVNVLPPSAMLGRLEQRLPLLAGGPRDAPDRLRSMRDAIAWSHDLLTPEERILFRRLSVFVGGLTLEAAEVVCLDEHGMRPSSILDGIASLVNKSLIPPLANATRFGMLETIREFGLVQLAASGEEGLIRRRHADYILALAKRAGPILLEEGGQLHWLRVFDEELPNVRAALTWLNETGEAERAAELTFALWRFWQIRDHYLEGVTWCNRALDHGERLPATLRANVLAERGFFEFFRLAPERALATLDEAAECALFAEDARAIAWSLILRAVAKLRMSDYEGAAVDAKESLALYTNLGDAWFVAEALWYVALISYFSGDADAAEVIFPQYLETMSALGDHFEIGGFSANVGSIALERRNEDQALSHFLRSLECGRLLDSDYLMTDAVEGIAVVLARRGESERAARLFGAIDALRTRSGPSRVRARDAYVKPTITSLRDTLGPDAMEAAWNAGQGMPIADVISDAEAAGALPISSTNREPEHRLSPRQLEVLHLVAAGRSDREIAEILFIARTTASDHVSNILSKLGVSTRAEAAAWAVRNGLA
jgi:predicted ATPase/DNA-binding CsgD family transcriptional regulator